jgi:hypothetical protein
MNPRFLFDQPSLTTVLLLFPTSLHQERIPIHVVYQIAQSVVMMRSLLSYRSQSIHRQLAHPSKYVFHSHPDPASQSVSLLVLLA